jgi:hypothetical protein
VSTVTNILNAREAQDALSIILPCGAVRRFTGRAAWALRHLIEAGPAGLTTIDKPGPRWSDYIFKLRRGGLTIETEHEAHGGPFAGHHARYRLRTPVQVAGRAAA